MRRSEKQDYQTISSHLSEAIHSKSAERKSRSHSHSSSLRDSVADLKQQSESTLSIPEKRKRDTVLAVVPLEDLKVNGGCKDRANMSGYEEEPVINLEKADDPRVEELADNSMVIQA